MADRQRSVMTDNYGYGKEKRRAQNLEVLAGKNTFRCVEYAPANHHDFSNNIALRDSFREMLTSVAERHPFDECTEILRKSRRLVNCVCCVTADEEANV